MNKKLLRSAAPVADRSPPRRQVECQLRRALSATICRKSCMATAISHSKLAHVPEIIKTKIQKREVAYASSCDIIGRNLWTRFECVGSAAGNGRCTHGLRRNIRRGLRQQQLRWL